MSLLSPARKKTKSGASSQWVFRMIFISLGLVGISTGWEAIRHGYWWIRSYDPTTGTIGVGTTLAFVFMGALFFIIALIPWPRAAKKRKSKDDIYEIH